MSWTIFSSFWTLKNKQTKNWIGRLTFQPICDIIGWIVLLDYRHWTVIQIPLNVVLYFYLQMLFVARKDLFSNSWFWNFLPSFRAEDFQFWAILGCLACLKCTHTVLMVFKLGFQKLQLALLELLHGEFWPFSCFRRHSFFYNWLVSKHPL